MANAISMNLEAPATRAVAEKRPQVSSALFYFLTAGQVTMSTLHVLLVHMSKGPAEVELVGESPDTAASVATPTTTHAAEFVYAYSPSVVMIVAELSKLVLCLLLFLGTNENPGELLRRDVSLRGFLQFSIPALVYAVENNMRFLVLRKLESPVTFVVFSHLEIPIVALMSVLCLHRHLNKLQWASVFLLVNGVMASQVSVCESQHAHSCSHLSDYPLLAVTIVALVSMLSALAGISTEYLFQRAYSTSIFLQNAQLYTYGTLINLAGLAAHEPQRLLHPATLFDGFDATVAGIVATLVLLGLFVSGVVKHMSNITKVYASACGIFITSIFSTFVSDFDMTFPFILAASQVVCALYLYHVDKPSLGKEGGGKPTPSQCPHCGNALAGARAALEEIEGEEDEDEDEVEDDLEDGEGKESVRLLPPPAASAAPS